MMSRRFLTTSSSPGDIANGSTAPSKYDLTKAQSEIIMYRFVAGMDVAINRRQESHAFWVTTCN